MPKLILNVENQRLSEEVKNLISKVDYPLRFELIKVSTSYKTDFLGGETNKNLEILINPENPILETPLLFRGFFARFIFLLINEKEGINKSIKEQIQIPEAVEFLQDFFADYKAVKYGFKKDMHRFFLERVLKKHYSEGGISKRDYIEFYSYYLIFKKTGNEGEIKSIIETTKVYGVEPLIAEMERLNYPNYLGDENFKKAWMSVFS